MMYKFYVSLLLLALLSACGQESTQSADNAAQSSEIASQPASTVAAPAVSAPAVKAPSSGQYVAGKHYRVLPRALPTHNPNTVEVAEFFWYGCGHCYTFEALAKPYKRDLPETIEFVAIPAMWSDIMVVHAKAHYAAKALAKPELHDALFKAMNVDRKRLASDSEVAALFAEYGVDKDEAMKLLASFGVSAQVNKARSLAAGAKLTGTPTLMVNGKYVVESSMAGSQADMLKVADYLAKLEVAR